MTANPTASAESQVPVFCAVHRDTEIVTEAGGPDMPTIHGRRYCPVCQEKLMEALSMAKPDTAARPFVRVEGTTWPNPNDPTDVEWRLRYGTPSKSDLLVAASFMHAYAYLLSMTQKDRNHRVTTIREAVDAD